MPYTYFSFICGNDVTVKAAHTSHITDLIKTFKTFDVFPNFAHTIAVKRMNTIAPMTPITHSFAVKFSRL